MSGFGASLQAFAVKTPKTLTAVHIGIAVELQRSIKFGSAVTGAPPMPVAVPKYPKAGALRDSVLLTYPDATTALIYTTKWYAPNVEDNTESHTFTSGGPHGWKLTAAAFPRVAELVVARQAGAR